MTEAKAVVNLSDLTLQAHSHGSKFAAQTGEIGRVLGFNRLGCMLHVVPPGKSAFPFHRHHASDEMFFVLYGTGEYRIGDRRLAIRTGDCLGAPAGGEAHQIINTGTEDLRYLGFGNIPDCEVVEYADSGNLLVKAGTAGNHYTSATFAKRGRLTSADYWDGEDTE